MFRHTAYATACGPAEDPRARLGAMWQAMTSGHGPGGHGHGPGGHGHGRGGRGRGFGPGFGPGFGGFGPGFGGPRGGPFRRGRARRGDVRTGALLLLAEEPRNGYQIMQELEERSHGQWRPSAGSIYPALQQLEDEGLVRAEETGGRKLFHLTDEGRAVVDARDESQLTPWDEMAGDVSDETLALRNLMRDTGFALFQLMQTGSDHQRTEARRILTEARRDLYLLLADGDPEEPGDTEQR